MSEEQPVDSLNNEYMGDDVYGSKVRDLAAKYRAIRRTRPDGNCFFRAFAYSYLEYLAGHKEDYDAFKELALKSKDKLVALGFPQFTLEDFHDTVSTNKLNFHLNSSLCPIHWGAQSTKVAW